MLKKIFLCLFFFFPTFGFANTEVFEAGLKDIEAFYIEKPDIRDLSIKGLKAIAHNGKINLSCNKSLCMIGNQKIQLPQNKSAYSWAVFLKHSMTAIKEQSPQLNLLDQEEIYEIFFDALTKQLDRFSRYKTPNEAKAYLNYAVSQKCTHLGMNLKQKHDGSYIIYRVTKPSPAFFAGIKSQSIIHKINDVDTKKLAGRPFYKALCGNERASTNLLIEMPNGKFTKKALTQHVTLKASLHYSYLETEKLLYLQMNRFSATSFNELQSIFKINLKGKAINGVVFDLRKNRGGLLDQAVKISDAFLDHGMILKTIGRHKASFQNFYADSDLIIPNSTPMIILIDSLTASSAEIMTEALKDQSRALIVGSRSYGKGVVQAVMQLPNRGELFLTWSQVISPSGDSFNKKGIKPLYCEKNADPELCKKLVHQFRDPLDLSFYLLKKPELFNHLLNRQTENNL